MDCLLATKLAKLDLKVGHLKWTPTFRPPFLTFFINMHQLPPCTSHAFTLTPALPPTYHVGNVTGNLWAKPEGRIYLTKEVIGKRTPKNLSSETRSQAVITGWQPVLWLKKLTYRP